MVAAFPLVQGKIALGAGVYSTGQSKLIHCETDGNVKLHFADGTELASYAMIGGDDRLLGETISGVEVLSGTFSIA